jgi:hypothetical protein
MFDYTIYKYWLVKILLQREPLSVSDVQNEIDASENLCIFSQTQPIFSSSDLGLLFSKDRFPIGKKTKSFVKNDPITIPTWLGSNWSSILSEED